jgi:GNAT superfamily N-acetyltransferase
MSNLRLDGLHREGLDRAVEIHLRAFPGFFLTILGSRFLRCLYSEIRDHPSGIVLCCCEGERMLGFVAGTIQPGRFYRQLLLRRWWRFGLAALWPVLRHPSIVPRLLNAFRKPGEAIQDARSAELMSIAVDPSAQGLGVGRLLVNGFLRQCGRSGVERVELTTDADNNDLVNQFYERTGFLKKRSFTSPQGRLMNEYMIQIDSGNDRLSAVVGG